MCEILNHDVALFSETSSSDEGSPNAKAKPRQYNTRQRERLRAIARSQQIGARTVVTEDAMGRLVCSGFVIMALELLLNVHDTIDVACRRARRRAAIISDASESSDDSLYGEQVLTAQVQTPEAASNCQDASPQVHTRIDEASSQGHQNLRCWLCMNIQQCDVQLVLLLFVVVLQV